jgi:hypothetical protein
MHLLAPAFEVIFTSGVVLCFVTPEVSQIHHSFFIAI